LEYTRIIPLQVAICACAESNRFEKSAIAPASLSCCALSPRFITTKDMTNPMHINARTMDKYCFIRQKRFHGAADASVARPALALAV
jgi:hypothetical protein